MTSSKVDKFQEGSIFCLGNPVLGLYSPVETEFIDRFVPEVIPDIGSNIINGETEEHDKFLSTLLEEYNVQYYPADGPMVVARWCQWLLGPNYAYVTSYAGAVADDYEGNLIEKELKNGGVKPCLQKIPEATTGTCAIAVSGGPNTPGKQGLGHRRKTRVLYLSAAGQYDPTDLGKYNEVIDMAHVFLISGLALGTEFDAVKRLVEHATDWGQEIALLLSAPWVMERYAEQLKYVAPHTDFVFCNESEAMAYAAFKSWDYTDIKDVCRAMALDFKAQNKGRTTRTVVITCGDTRPILMSTTDHCNPVEFPVEEKLATPMVDEVNAGDALVGGFLGAYVQGKPMDTCVRVGRHLAALSVQQKCNSVPPNICTLKIDDIK